MHLEQPQVTPAPSRARPVFPPRPSSCCLVSTACPPALGAVPVWFHPSLPSSLPAGHSGWAECSVLVVRESGLLLQVTHRLSECLPSARWSSTLCPRGRAEDALGSTGSVPGPPPALYSNRTAPTDVSEEHELIVETMTPAASSPAASSPQRGSYPDFVSLELSLEAP